MKKIIIKSEFEWLIKRYMVKAHIRSLAELAKETGIQYRTLQNRILNPKLLRLFEIQALDCVLEFSDEDRIRIMRGEVA